MDIGSKIYSFRTKNGLSRTWIGIVFVSFVFAVVVSVMSVFQSRESSENGEEGFAKLNKWATEKELKSRMHVSDGFDDLNETVVDLRAMVVKRTKMTDEVSNMSLIAEALLPELFTPDSACATRVKLRKFNGEMDNRRRVNSFSKITRTFPEVMGKFDCHLNKKDARNFLCERGIMNNGLVQEAIRDDKFCTREMAKSDCHLFKACVRRIIREHYSEPVGNRPFTVLVGDGMSAAIPDNFRFQCPAYL